MSSCFRRIMRRGHTLPYSVDVDDNQIYQILDDAGVPDMNMHSQMRTQGIFSGKNHAAGAETHGKFEDQAT